MGNSPIIYKQEQLFGEEKRKKRLQKENKIEFCRRKTIAVSLQSFDFIHHFFNNFEQSLTTVEIECIIKKENRLQK